jgi:hypothetical protein
VLLAHIELKEANEFIASHHRHHMPAVGHRYSLGARGPGPTGTLRGVAIVGRPVARGFDFRTTVEVTRLCTDGTKNACSFLYSAAARAAKALGYARIGTYILESENGTSLLATGWTKGHTTKGGDWNCKARTGRRVDQPMEPKVYWYKDF